VISFHSIKWTFRIFQWKIREKICMFKLTFGNKSWHENSNNINVTSKIYNKKKSTKVIQTLVLGSTPNSLVNVCMLCERSASCCMCQAVCVNLRSVYFKVSHSGVSCHVSVEVLYNMLGSMNSAASSCMWKKCTTLLQWITGNFCGTGSARSHCQEMVTCL